MNNLILEQELNSLLEVDKVKRDYCPNGLQVQGVKDVSKIVTGVTASLEFIEEAIKAKADAMIVHHGIVWNYQDGTINNMYKERLKKIFDSGMNLYAYHLPLDQSLASFGNNIALMEHLGLFTNEIPPGNNFIIAKTSMPVDLSDLVSYIDKKLDRVSIAITPKDNVNPKVSSVGICTGAAGIYFESAIKAGVDVFLTGEISEQHYHMVQESGVSYIAAGHHATERYGIMNLGNYISAEFNVNVQWIDINNPI